MVSCRERVWLNLMPLAALLSAPGCGGRADSARASADAAQGVGGVASTATSGASASGSGGSEQITTPPGAGNAGADSSSAAGGPSSAGSAPIDAGVLMAPDAGPIVVGPRPTCGGSGADTDNSCASLEALKFENPEFTWEYGGLGEVVVTITNTGSGIVPYPCFGITVDQPTTNLPTMLEPDVYVLKAGESGPYTFPVQFAEPVPHGTVLHFTVWVDSLNVGCADVGEFSFTAIAI